MLYTLTTGRHPFAGVDSAEMLQNIVSDEPPIRPSLLKPNYSRTLEAVVLKALEKDRSGRWPSAEEMRLALQRGVPQAFELGFEAQLRNFMGDTVGDLATRKREALRRAELAVDAQAAQPQSSGTAISVASLRAISVDTSKLTDSARPQRPSVLPTLRPSLRASLRPSLQAIAAVARPRSFRLLGGGIALAAALVFGLVWLRSSSSAPQAATAPTTAMVDLSPPRAASVAALPTVSAPVSVSSGIAPGIRRPLERRH
jgi:serine/threonine-protein kinase